jgi:hypothetical protein
MAMDLRDFFGGKGAGFRKGYGADNTSNPAAFR